MTVPSRTEPVYRYPVTPRYFEFDQQGIVFNAWYLAWFDDAQAGYFAFRGVPMAELIAGGPDVRLARTVYVVVDTQQFRPAAVPDHLRAALS